MSGGPLILFLAAGSAVLIARYAILAAQLGKLSEEGGEERPDGDCFPAPLFGSSFHTSGDKR